LADLVADGLST